jgi:hypothetical protein
MKLFAATLAAFTATLVAAPVGAGLRCGRDLVEEGDSVAQLMLTCGEPMLRQTIAVDNTSTTEGIVEQWTYHFGRGTFLTIVTIEAGKVAVIEEGARQ